MVSHPNNVKYIGDTVSFTSVTIISPEAANGRNVVALGVTKTLAAAGKTGVFRPAVCRKDTFTDVLIEASNAGLSREQSVGVCPKRARNDKEGSRADIVAAYTQSRRNSPTGCHGDCRHRQVSSQ